MAMPPADTHHLAINFLHTGRDNRWNRNRTTDGAVAFPRTINPNAAFNVRPTELVEKVYMAKCG
jgi:hypothetical protein